MLNVIINKQFSDLESRFYTYIYLDPRKQGKFTYNNLNITFLNEPFYVGKGTRSRCKVHLTPSSCKLAYNIVLTNKIKKLKRLGIKPIIIKIVSNITEECAYNLETQMIKCIGRLCDKTGPLVNLESGGCRGKALSFITRQKISNKNKGVKRSLEWKKHLSEVTTGIKKSLEYRAMMSRNRRGSDNPGARKYLFIDPNGLQYQCDGAFRQFTQEHNLDYSMLRTTLFTNEPLQRGKYKGWFAKYNDKTIV